MVDFLLILYRIVTHMISCTFLLYGLSCLRSAMMHSQILGSCIERAVGSLLLSVLLYCLSVFSRQATTLKEHNAQFRHIKDFKTSTVLQCSVATVVLLCFVFALTFQIKDSKTSDMVFKYYDKSAVDVLSFPDFLYMDRLDCLSFVLSGLDDKDIILNPSKSDRKVISKLQDEFFEQYTPNHVTIVTAIILLPLASMAGLIVARWKLYKSRLREIKARRK